MDSWVTIITYLFICLELIFTFQSLIKKEDICNGTEMNEFLAYEGDAHIAYVRKTPEISVPRFDKVSCKSICSVLH